MYDTVKMTDALRAFDWERVLSLLPEQTPEAFSEILTDTLRSGCFIRLYKLPPKQEKRRDATISSLREFARSIGGEEAAQAVEDLLRQVELTELALGQIEESVVADSYSRLSPEKQAWAAIQWAFQEMMDVYRQMEEGLARQAEGSAQSVFIDPLNLRVDAHHGFGLARGRIGQLSATLANTLRMLGHRNRWNEGGKLSLPPFIQCEASDLEAAGRISRFGDHWQAVVDESKHHRFWGGRFVVREPNDEMRKLQPSLEHVIVSEMTDRQRRDDFQVAEFIAQNRIERRLLNVSQHMEHKTDAAKRIGDPRTGSMQLPPLGLVSLLEFTTLYVLDNDMYFNAIKGKNEYGGLTIAEWLRGYCILEHNYARQTEPGLTGIVQIDPAELRRTLERGGLSTAKADLFIERATFQSGRRDLYDAPLISTVDGSLFFAAALYRGVNLALVIASQIGSQELNVETKGKDFEKAVLQMFRAAGIPAASFKFTVRGTQYDCDVAVLWGGHLFVFECKNYGLPTADPADRLFFWQKQVAAMRQVKRIAADLQGNPQIVREQFGDGESWTTVHPVVLNASFLSFIRSPDGTFFYDGSALGRFLKEGSLSQVEWTQDGSVVREQHEVVRRLWRGSRPTAEDLIRAMRRPAQMMMERDEYYLATRLLMLSESTALLAKGPASKGPDFQPMLGGKEHRNLLTKVSRRQRHKK